jgi:hypothetical protein
MGTADGDARRLRALQQPVVLDRLANVADVALKITVCDEPTRPVLATLCLQPDQPDQPDLPNRYEEFRRRDLIWCE